MIDDRGQVASDHGEVLKLGLSRPVCFRGDEPGDDWRSGTYTAHSQTQLSSGTQSLQNFSHVPRALTALLSCSKHTHTPRTIKLSYLLALRVCRIFSCSVGPDSIIELQQAHTQQTKFVICTRSKE